MPTKIEDERVMLREAELGGLGSRIGTYVKLSGPGWLQSAITLGGGSLASSLFLGVLAGYSLLWLQPVAIVLGVIMLCAISHVALSTGQSPFKAINEDINPVLGWGWAIATILANVVWCLPQFSLGTAAATQNLFPALNNTWGKVLVCVLLLAAAIAAILAYDRGAKGAKAFDRILKLMVALIVLAFVGVVVKMGASGKLPWSEIAAGFIPDPSLFSEPSAKYDEALAATGEFSEFWKSQIVTMQKDVMISAAATAVGINMTFFMPFVLLRRRWGREHRGLAKFDLWTALLIPYVVATSCVVIAAGSQFNVKPQSAYVDYQERTLEGNLEKGYDGLVNARLSLELGPEAYEKLAPVQKKELKENLSDADKDMAAMLVKRDAFNLAKSLKNLTGEVFSHWIFGIGVLGMALSTIIILMTINGHVICEVIGVPHKGKPFILGALLAGLGVLGPFIWSDAAFWLAVPTSVFGFTLIPVAYLSFFLLMNSKKVLGRERPTGGFRLIWNTGMLFALAIMGTAAVYVAWNKKWGDVAFGKYALIIYGVMLVIGHFHLKTSRLEKKVAAMDNRVRRQGGGGGSRKSSDGGGRKDREDRERQGGGNRGRRSGGRGRSGGGRGRRDDKSSGSESE
jgi:Mn2+/Fe2+ NRAMP family transporter